MANILNGIKRAGSYALDSFYENLGKRLGEAAVQERILGIEKATSAMIEAGVDEHRVIEMLQKHWDLRLSEAQAFIENAKEEIERNDQ